MPSLPERSGVRIILSGVIVNWCTKKAATLLSKRFTVIALTGFIGLTFVSSWYDTFPSNHDVRNMARQLHGAERLSSLNCLTFGPASMCGCEPAGGDAMRCASSVWSAGPHGYVLISAVIRMAPTCCLSG